MGSFFSVVKLVLTVNIPFGAAVLTIFFWRRVNAPAVWACVILSTICILAIPVLAVKVPTVKTNPSLATLAPGPAGKPAPVYFDAVVHEDPSNLSSRLVGSGRFNFEMLGPQQNRSRRGWRSPRTSVLPGDVFLRRAVFPFVDADRG